MGRWGQGIFENDDAGDILLHFLDDLVMKLENNLELEEVDFWFPDRSLATAFILEKIATSTSSANFCSCDAKTWRSRIENILRQYGLKYCDGSDDLTYEAAENALNLFDRLIARAQEHDGDCDCGGDWHKVYLKNKVAKS